MAQKSYTRVESVKKACQILAVLAEAREPMTGADIATYLQMPPGTVMSQLVTLEDEGLVQEVGGGWRLGMKMAVYWARIRSTMEAERDRLTTKIRSIGGE